MKPRVLNLLAICSVLLIYSSVLADRNLRCGTRLVSIGDKMSEVGDACGEPDHIQRRGEGENAWIQRSFDYKTERYVAPMLIKGPIRVEVWTYNLGPHRFIRRLHFQNGELIRIETEEKGD